MRIARLSMLAALASSMMWMGWALAQEGLPNTKDEAALKANFDRATVLRTFVVKNTKGEELGRVRDFLINSQGGRVLYAAVGHGGTLGIGEKLLAVPLQAMRIEAPKDRPTERYFVLDAEKSTIDNSPGFDKQDWPTAPDAHFLKLVAPAEKDKVVARRATVLTSMAAKTPKGENLGTIRDLMIDTHHATVIYAALGHGGGVLTADKMFAVPWDALQLTTLTGKAADECLVLDVQKSILDNSPGFTTNHWPAEGDRAMFKKAEPTK